MSSPKEYWHIFNMIYLGIVLKLKEAKVIKAQQENGTTCS